MITKTLGNVFDPSRFDKDVNAQTGDSAGQIFGYPYQIRYDPDTDTKELLLEADSLTAQEDTDLDNLISNHVHALPYLKLTWSGNGAADPDDGVYEMTADGVNQATLTIEKWDSSADPEVQMTGAGDDEKLTVRCAGPASPSAGRVQLSNGTASVTFTPTANQIAHQTVTIKSISGDVMEAETEIRFV